MFEVVKREKGEGVVEIALIYSWIRKSKRVIDRLMMMTKRNVRILLTNCAIRSDKFVCSFIKISRINYFEIMTYYSDINLLPKKPNLLLTSNGRYLHIIYFIEIDKIGVKSFSYACKWIEKMMIQKKISILEYNNAQANCRCLVWKKKQRSQIKYRIFSRTDISPEQVNKLESLNNPESIHKSVDCIDFQLKSKQRMYSSFFIKIFGLQPNTKPTTILCDLFYYAFNFARTNKFNAEQISAFISILKRVHDMCICMLKPFTYFSTKKEPMISFRHAVC